MLKNRLVRHKMWDAQKEGLRNKMKMAVFGPMS